MCCVWNIFQTVPRFRPVAVRRPPEAPCPVPRRRRSMTFSCLSAATSPSMAPRIAAPSPATADDLPDPGVHHTFGCLAASGSAGDEGIKFRGTPRPAASDKLHEIKTLDELLIVLRLTLCPPGVAWRGQEIYASDYASPRPPAAKTSTTTAPLPPPTPAIVTPCVTGGRWAARARARAARTGPRACRLARRTRSRAACTWFGVGFGFGLGLGLP